MTQPYLSLEAEFHDAFWEEDDDGSEISLMGDFLEEHPGPAVEMGSGSGRLLFPLVMEGFEIEGVELSADMIRLCERKAEEMEVPVTTHFGDMGSWDPQRKFAAVLAPAFTLQLAADPLPVLRHWHSLLEKGGGLYLTIFIPVAELEGELKEGEWYADHEGKLEDGREIRLSTRHRIDPEAQVLEREHRYFFAANPTNFHESRQRLRWFTHEQMQGLLEQAGFEVRAAFVDFDPESPAASAEPEDFDGILTYQAVAR